MINKVANGLANIINNALSNWKNLLKLIGIVVGIIILILIIANLFRGRDYSFYQVENILKNAAIAYYKENEILLPNANNPITRIDSSQLIENKHMRSLTRLLPSNICTAHVDVRFHENEHIYIPFLDCGEAFKTELLVDIVTKNTVEGGEGLYIIGNEHIYRGEKVNNFVFFDDILWHIVKVDENRNIRLVTADTLKNERGRDLDRFVWDDRFNVTEQSSHGINNYSVSRIRHTLNNQILNMLEDNLDDLVYFQGCIGKRTRPFYTNDGSLECSELDNFAKISLLSLYEYIFASMDPTCRAADDSQCQNYNYLALFKDRWWTLTGDGDTTHRVFSVNTSGVINSERASEKASIRPVIMLNRFILFQSGEGTRENPFKVR